MSQSSKKVTTDKVGKPHPDFPLMPDSRNWCKTIKKALVAKGEVIKIDDGKYQLA
jgi:hypothetical protein